MNYSTWNNILCEHFFNQKECRVFISIDKEGLINLALSSPEFIEQLEKQGKLSVDIEEKKRRAWIDYIHIFGRIIEHQWTCSKSLIINDFQKRMQESINPQKTPTIFPYLALFIMPLSITTDVKANAVYGKITDFWHRENLIKEKEVININDFKDFRPSLDCMWNSLREWAIINGYKFDVISKNPNGHNRYAYPFFEQLIFTSSQRDNFKLLFYNAGLTPGQDVSEKEASLILTKYYTSLGVTPQRWNNLKKENMQSVLSIFFQELNAWDGIAYVRNSRNCTSNTEYLGVRQNLLLEVSKFRGLYEIRLKANLPDAGFGEDFLYKSTLLGNYSFTTDNQGLADKSIEWSDKLNEFFVSLQPISFVKDGDKGISLIYTPKTIELLEYSYGNYITSRKIQKGRKFLVLLKRTEKDNYTQWLLDNNANLITKHPLRDYFDLYKIENATTDLKIGNVNRFQFETSIDCGLVNTLVLGKNSNGSTLIYEGLPAYFQVSGIDVLNDKLFACFKYEGQNHKIELSYDERSNLWVLPKVDNDILKRVPFFVYHNNKPISKQFEVIDFFLKSEYSEMVFNKYGEYDVNGQYKGLELETSNDVNWDNLKGFMQRRNNPIPESNNTDYLEEDYLLYYLSTQIRCEKNVFVKTIEVLSQNEKFKFDGNNKWAIKNIIDNYFRLGYINYSYYDNKHLLSVNKPTLILLPPKVRVEYTPLKETIPLENYWTCLLTGARTPAFMRTLFKNIEVIKCEEKISIDIIPSSDKLLPQTVYVRANKLETIETIAKMSNISFQKCIYSNTLLASLASVDEYLSYCTLFESDDKYDGITNLEKIDYALLANAGKCNKISEFSRDNSVVTYFPGTYREQSIIWKDGKQYKTDKHWGHLIGMFIENAKVIKVSEDGNSIKLPIVLQLPKLYARALTMITGKIPTEEGFERTYDYYNNPFATCTDIHKFLTKLSQK